MKDKHCESNHNHCKSIITLKIPNSHTLNFISKVGGVAKQRNVFSNIDGT